MTNSIAQRTAIVTGAAQGIGAGIARSLHRAGYPVVLADLNLAGAQKLAEELKKEGDAPLLPVAVDVRRKEQIEAMVAAAVEWRGNVSILVNNAARTQARDFMEVTPEEWDDVMATNLRSVLFACQAAVPHMRKQGWGRIVNLSSLAGQRGGPQVQGPHYACSKAGIIELTRYLAFDVAKYGISVNAIAPGPILTEQTALAPPDKLALVSQSVPLGRLGRVDEIGELVNYLVSDAGGFAVGATFDINGGLLMR